MIQDKDIEKHKEVLRGIKEFTLPLSLEMGQSDFEGITNKEKLEESLQFFIDFAERYQKVKGLKREVIYGILYDLVNDAHHLSGIKEASRIQKAMFDILAECKMAVVKMRPTEDELRKIIKENIYCEFVHKENIKNLVEALLKEWDRKMEVKNVDI